MNGHGYGYQGQRAGDPWNRNNNSAVSKIEHTFWVTKQNMFRKLGKKEDDCVVASDAELDAKLELFRSVQDTCQELQRVLDKYQERLCNLAQEESAMGRFLKECSKRDQTNAGKAMIAVGKSLSYSGQQRLALRVPLHRLYQEVDTFRQRAIEDTLLNVTAMERQRTEYRASLSWMKNVSQELDPDTFKQLEKFRKVQGQVRQSKANFDKLKLDCLQKVDLLAAARCNMFSHALTLYHTAVIQHARRACRAYTIVARQIKGYQHFEFSVVPELTEESSRLAKQTNEDAEKQRADESDKDELLFFDTDYHDKDEKPGDAAAPNAAQKSDSLQNLLQGVGAQSLIPLDTEMNNSNKKSEEMTEIDLLASDCLSQLDDILCNASDESTSALDSVEDWAALFGDNSAGIAPTEDAAAGSAPVMDFNFGLGSENAGGGFLPSQLLDNFTSSLQLNALFQPDAPQGGSVAESTTPGSANGTVTTPTSSLNFMSNFMSNLRPTQTTQMPATTAPASSSGLQAGMPVAPHSPQTTHGASLSPQASKTGKSSKKDMSAWYDLFADLDPLANPDALGSTNPEEERNC